MVDTHLFIGMTLGFNRWRFINKLLEKYATMKLADVPVNAYKHIMTTLTGGFNMKWLTSQKWQLFCLCFFLLLGQSSLLWAQSEPEEEEEETIQTRPNPFEKTILKGREEISVKGSQVNRGLNARKPSGQNNQMIQQTGKAMSHKVQSGVGSSQAAQPGAAMQPMK